MDTLFGRRVAYYTGLRQRVAIRGIHTLMDTGFARVGKSVVSHFYAEGDTSTPVGPGRLRRAAQFRLLLSIASLCAVTSWRYTLTSTHRNWENSVR